MAKGNAVLGIHSSPPGVGAEIAAKKRFNENAMAAAVGALGTPPDVRVRGSARPEIRKPKVVEVAAIAERHRRRGHAPGLAVGDLGSRGHVAIKGPALRVKVRRSPVAIAAARAERAMVAVVGADGRRAQGRGNVPQARSNLSVKTIRSRGLGRI